MRFGARRGCAKPDQGNGEAIIVPSLKAFAEAGWKDRLSPPLFPVFPLLSGVFPPGRRAVSGDIPALSRPVFGGRTPSATRPNSATAKATATSDA
jgi:hypothetical protein